MITFGSKYRIAYNRKLQIDIATQALNDLFNHNRIIEKTLCEAAEAKISEPRLKAMVRFIELKGPPKQYERVYP